MRYFLMAFLLIGNEAWRIGDSLDGPEYEPTPYTTIEECMELRFDRQRNAVRPNGVKEIHWACVPDFEEGDKS